MICFILYACSLSEIDRGPASESYKIMRHQKSYNSCYSIVYELINNRMVLDKKIFESIVLGPPEASMMQDDYFGEMIRRGLMTEDEVRYYRNVIFKRDPSTITTISVSNPTRPLRQEDPRYKTTLMIFSGQKIKEDMQIGYFDLPWQAQFPEEAKIYYDPKHFAYAWEVGRVKNSEKLVQGNYSLAALVIDRELESIMSLTQAFDAEKAFIFIHATDQVHARLYERIYGFKKLFTTRKKAINLDGSPKLDAIGSEVIEEHTILYISVREATEKFQSYKVINKIQTFSSQNKLTYKEAYEFLTQWIGSKKEVLDIVAAKDNEYLNEKFYIHDEGPLYLIRRRILLNKIELPPSDELETASILDQEFFKPHGFDIQEIDAIKNSKFRLEFTPFGDRKLDPREVRIGLLATLAYYRSELIKNGIKDPDELIRKIDFYTTTKTDLESTTPYEILGFEKIKNTTKNFFTRAEKIFYQNPAHSPRNVDEVVKDSSPVEEQRWRKILQEQMQRDFQNFVKSHNDEYFYVNIAQNSRIVRHILRLRGSVLLDLEKTSNISKEEINHFFNKSQRHQLFKLQDLFM